MARSIDYGYTPTVSQTRTVALHDIDFATNFAKDDDSANEAVVTNINAPVARPSTFRFLTESVSNVYNDTKIDPALRSDKVRRGRKVLVTKRDVWKLTDSADASFEVALPVSGNLTLRVPNCEDITASDLFKFVMDLVSAAFQETGTADGTRIIELLRGVELPSSMR